MKSAPRRRMRWSAPSSYPPLRSAESCKCACYYPPAPQDLEFSCEQVFFLPFAPLPSASGQQLLSAKA